MAEIVRLCGALYLFFGARVVTAFWLDFAAETDINLKGFVFTRAF